MGAQVDRHVTVIMSIYQPDREYLAQQLESIAAQDHDRLDVLVRNDCPADEDLGDFCRGHCPGIELTYVHGSRNLGYARGFERLVQLAAPGCDVLALCDQDDLWLPTRVSHGLAPIEEGALLSACDYAIIDGEGTVTVPSWRAAHPKDPACRWHTGDRFVAESIFTAFSPGMAMMVRADVARGLLPFSRATGHDKWLMTGANIQGTCAFVDEPLVLYRRHGHNVSGVLAGVHRKQDWYDTRVADHLRFAEDAKRRFPSCPELDEALAFAQARQERDLAGIWRHRHLAPQIARFEMALKLTPDPLFRLALGRR